MTRKNIFKVLKGTLILMLLVGGGLCCLGNFNIERLPIVKTNKDLRIVSINVSADNILSASFQDNLIQTQADIIVIIEWTGNNFNLDKFVKAGYQINLNHPRKKVHGICILSKLNGLSTIIEAPIKTPCMLPIGQFRFKWKDNYLTLFAVHAPPPVPSCNGTTSEYIKAIGYWIDSGTLSHKIGVGKQGDPVIMAGDFNSFPFDKGIEYLKSKHLKDSYSKYNFTSPTWKPLNVFPYVAKIDYILYSQKFIPTSTKRFNIDNSDHLGLLTDLTF